MQSHIPYNGAFPRTCFLHAAQLSVSVLFFLLFLGGYAQSVPDTFLKTVDSLVQAKPVAFADIHRVLGQKSNDTLLMRHVANTSAVNRYGAGQSYALNELGRAYRNISQYNRAIALHNEALAIAEKDDNLEFRVYSLNNLGVAYRRISSIRTAMDYNQRALELAQTVEDPSESLKRSINVSFNGIGNLYLKLKQYDQATDYFEKSLKLEAELGNTRGLAVNHHNIGRCLEEQGKLDLALENYRTALAYDEQIDNDMGRVISKTSIAQIYLKQNLTDEAQNLLKTALPVAQRLGDGFLIAPVYIDMGWAQMRSGEFGKSEENILYGLKLADSLKLQEVSAQANHLLSELYRQIGDYKKALDHKLKADQIDEEIVNEVTVRYVTDIIYRYNSVKDSNNLQLLAQQNEMYEMQLRANKTQLRTTKTTLLISGIALALLAGIFYILYRQYQLKNEKKLLTLEQSMLRSQMNPHFLFNSLNSIKLYIINNEQKNAVHYLNKFSKLVRKILESSSVREIPLAEELETVELYMTIENIRFSNEINFDITIDTDIDTHTVRIPSLILQPFLENALWHGLSSKQGEKKINLHVSSDKEGFIHIAITDNGIGRAASEKLKANKILKRKSVGIDITKERLSNFAKEYQNPFHLEIIDLYDELGKASGTKVVLHLPTI